MIAQYCIVVFLTQLVFIGTRTWNIRCIARNDIFGVLLSGAIVHVAWLISIGIGAISVKEIITDFNYSFIPVILCSLLGGLIGSFLALKQKSNS